MDISAADIANRKELIKRNPSIDIAKYVAAILVIAIHTHPFKNILPALDFIFVEILCRFAVPFFAVCTGYYLSTGRIAGSFKKIAKLYVFWSLVYLVYLSIFWWRSGLDVTWRYYVGWLQGAVCSFSFYHLWYLNAMCWGIFGFGLLRRYVKSRFYLMIACCLWCIQVLWYAYNGWFHILPEKITRYMDLISSPINGITMMLPLLLTGWLFRKYEGKMSHKLVIVVALVCFTCLCIEVYSLRLVGIDRYSFVFFTLPCAFFTFACVCMTKLKWRVGGYSKHLASASLTVYCIHPIIIGVMAYNAYDDPMLQFVFAAVVSTLLAFGYEISKKIIKNHIK